MLGKLAPSWAQSKIDRLMLSPKNKLSKPIRVPRDFKTISFSTKDGKLNAYTTGKGPMVVFVHGWGGGAYQFFPLMRGLSSCGFSSLAFDHVGHGQSEQNSTSLHQFISSTNSVLMAVRKQPEFGLAAVVAHSMGSLAVANAAPSLIKDIPLFLVSPIFDYKQFYIRQVEQLGLHKTLIDQYAQGFEESYAMHFQRMELANKLIDYSNQTEIVHDQDDEVSDIRLSEAFCTTYPLTKLYTTKRLGHERVLTSEVVWHELKSHLNYEDTTQNLFRKQVV